MPVTACRRPTEINIFLQPQYNCIRNLPTLTLHGYQKLAKDGPEEIGRRLLPRKTRKRLSAARGLHQMDDVESE